METKINEDFYLLTADKNYVVSTLANPSNPTFPYQTAVIIPGDPPRLENAIRYPNETDAIKGHQAACNKYIGKDK